jgi:hypothetical protein
VREFLLPNAVFSIRAYSLPGVRLGSLRLVPASGLLRAANALTSVANNDPFEGTFEIRWGDGLMYVIPELRKEKRKSILALKGEILDGKLPPKE